MAHILIARRQNGKGQFAAGCRTLSPQQILLLGDHLIDVMQTGKACRPNQPILRVDHQGATLCRRNGIKGRAAIQKQRIAIPQGGQRSFTEPGLQLQMRLK